MPWVSTMSDQRAASLLAAGLLIWSVRPRGVSCRRVCRSSMFAATAGVWLFYVQHQFEGTTWRQQRRTGASPRRRCTAVRVTDLPSPLRWFSANIGVHHVHHLCERHSVLSAAARSCGTIPNCGEVGRLSLWKSFTCVRLALWDEAKGRLVSFREASESRQASGGGQTARR